MNQFPSDWSFLPNETFIRTGENIESVSSIFTMEMGDTFDDPFSSKTSSRKDFPSKKESFSSKWTRINVALISSMHISIGWRILSPHHSTSISGMQSLEDLLLRWSSSSTKISSRRFNFFFGCFLSVADWDGFVQRWMISSSHLSNPFSILLTFFSRYENFLHWTWIFFSLSLCRLDEDLDFSNNENPSDGHWPIRHFSPTLSTFRRKKGELIQSSFSPCSFDQLFENEKCFCSWLCSVKNPWQWIRWRDENLSSRRSTMEILLSLLGWKGWRLKFSSDQWSNRTSNSLENSSFSKKFLIVHCCWITSSIREQINCSLFNGRKPPLYFFKEQRRFDPVASSMELFLSLEQHLIFSFAHRFSSDWPISLSMWTHQSRERKSFVQSKMICSSCRTMLDVIPLTIRHSEPFHRSDRWSMKRCNDLPSTLFQMNKNGSKWSNPPWGSIFSVNIGFCLCHFPLRSPLWIESKWKSIEFICGLVSFSWRMSIWIVFIEFISTGFDFLVTLDRSSSWWNRFAILIIAEKFFLLHCSLRIKDRENDID